MSGCAPRPQGSQDNKPPGSFKVTDLIIIQNQIKSPTGLSRKRRVLKVTEVLKEWKNPSEPEFQDLLVYNPHTDQLEPTKDLLEGKSVFIKNILERATGYKDYNAVLQDIKLRAWAKKQMCDLAPDDSYLEGNYMVRANVELAIAMDQYQPLESKDNFQKFAEHYTHKLQGIFEKK